MRGGLIATVRGDAAHFHDDEGVPGVAEHDDATASLIARGSIPKVDHRRALRIAASLPPGPPPSKSVGGAGTGEQTTSLQ